jgi:hypothetical protein
MPIQDTIMRGGTNIRKIIDNHLSIQVPAAIDIMRLQNADLDDKSLPYPKRYNSVDPLVSDEYPYMGSFVTGGNNYTQREILPSGSLKVEPTYETTIFVATATPFLGLDAANLPMFEKPYRESSLRLRDDLMAIMLNCILNSPSLGTAGSEFRALADIESIRVTYTEPIKRGNDSNPIWVCSGILVIDISLIESTVVPFIGNANIIESSLTNMLQ